jgi:hypothetical protein
MNEHWLIDLVSLSELQIQLFGGLLVVRTVEQHDAIGATPRLKTCRSHAEIPDLQLVRDDVLALLLFLLLAHTGDLYLRRDNLDRMPRRVQHREAHCNLVLPLPHIAKRRLELLVLPLAPIRRADALLLARTRVGVPMAALLRTISPTRQEVPLKLLPRYFRLPPNEDGIGLLLNSSVASMRLDHIKKAHIQTLQLPGSASWQNCALSTLRRMLAIAKEWGLLCEVPTFPLLEQRQRRDVFDQEV